MIKEIVNHSLDLSLNSETLDPSLFNEKLFSEIGIISENNQLDREKIRIGSIETFLAFKNESNDKIKVERDKITISSKELERIRLILASLSIQIGKFIISDALFTSDFHLTGKGLPNNVLNSFSSFKELSLDVVRYNIDESQLTMYLCKENKLHFQVSTKMTPCSSFDEIIIDEFDNMAVILDKFATNHLKLNFNE